LAESLAKGGLIRQSLFEGLLDEFFNRQVNPVRGRRLDGVVEVIKLTEYGAQFCFVARDGSTANRTCHPEFLSKHIVLDNQVERMLREYMKDSRIGSAKQKQRHRLVVGLRETLINSGDDAPQWLQDISALVDSCLSRYEAEEQDKTTFGDMFE